MEKRQELKRTEDKLNDLAKEAIKPSANGEHPQMREIRNLEKKLAESVLRYEEAYENRRCYDQIMKRLKEERMGYDNKIAELDNRLKAKELECAQAPRIPEPTPRPLSCLAVREKACQARYQTNLAG